jgi:hypothetical protein
MKAQTIVLAIIATTLVQVTHAQGVRVLSQATNSTVIEVIPDSVKMDTIKTGGVSYLNLVFKHAGPEFNSQGRYLKEFIPVLVGVFSRQIQVQVLQTDYQTRSMMRPVRSPRGSAVQAPVSVSEFVSYDKPSEQRRHLVSRIRVYPFLYDSLSGSYKILRRIVVQVTSSGSAVTYRSSVKDRLLSQSLVNYSQVRNVVLSSGVSSGGGLNQIRKIQASSVLASGAWYSLQVYQSGIYKLTYQNLKAANAPVDSIHLNTIKIYNDGGTELPEDPTASRPDSLIENAIFVSNTNTDGTDKFEADDYVLFYGKSPREWSYDSSEKTFSHYLNHYTEANYYFLTYGGQDGKRMPSIQTVSSPSPYVPQNFTCGIAADSELYNLQGSGKDWFGAELVPESSTNSGSNSIVYLNKLYDIDSTQNITYRMRLVSRSTAGNHFNIYENSTGTLLGQIYGGTIISYSSLDMDYYGVFVNTPDYTGTGYLSGDMSALKIAYYSDSPSAQAFVDWFEIFYKRKFRALNDVLDFYGPDTNAVVYDTIRSFSSNDVKIFDVTDFSNVGIVQPSSVSNGTASFGFQATAGAPRQFFAIGENGYLKVSGISAVGNSNLRGQFAGADLIIVTAPDFVSQANNLGSFKESFDGLKTIVVTTTDIYDEFNCGIPDPTAIRDYLRFAYLTQSTSGQIPSYVIFIGAGSYDYKNRVASMPEYVPAYESDESLYLVDPSNAGTYSSDDYFVDFNGDPTATPISMSIGRLSARTAQDADTMVSKIKQYEQNPIYGDWRNLVTFVGDDDVTTGVVNDEGSSLFTDDCETLSSNIYTPAEFDERKIYLGVYPTVVSTEGRRKPEAAADMVNQINQGTMILNYVGHGAPNVWSYANVFNNDVTIPQLTNITKLSLFVAATCDFGRDDDPVTQSGAELLLLSSKGGAIGIVSSTRTVYDNSNLDLNEEFFSQVFTRDSLRNPVRIGDAFYLTKSSRYGSNDVKYNYIGDPTVRIAFPKYQATVDSLNGKTLSIQTQPQQIRALDTLELKGTILQPDKTVWSDFTGTALLTIFDSDKNILLPQWSDSFVSQGSILFRGEISMKNGLFDARAVIPKDISYTGSAGKVELYFEASGSDGSGYTRNVTVGGTDTSRVNNHIGPEISIFFDSTNFVDGDVVSQNPTLIVDLHSVNGINLSDAAVGHDLQATFYPESQTVDLGPYYIANMNSYQDGTVKYPVTLSLAQGKHSVTVTAFDVFNNSSEASATFDLETSEQLSLTDVYNYPDPFRSNTAFTFRRTAVGGAGTPVDVKIKVFTLSGRLIKTILAYGLTDTFVKIDWDGLDDDGNRLANGVYLYMVVVSTVDGSQTSQAIGKMAVVR